MAARTDRVVIRPPEPTDCREFLAAVRASRRLHGSWVSPPATPQAFRRYLDGCRTDRRQCRLVCRREDGAIAGVININEIIRGPAQMAFLGYYGLMPHASRGYMTEGLERVLHLAFTVLKLHRLEANIQPPNRASIALVRRCGFHKEGFSPRYLKLAGRWRDHERWALLAEEWKQRPRSEAGSPG